MRNFGSWRCQMLLATMPLVLPMAAYAQDGDQAAQTSLQPTSAEVTTAEDGRLLYPAAYFTTFGPATALDIVQRVPGFSLDAGDTDIRGFGGAAGNLVINGERPSAKSDALQTILARIPASRVLRLEVGSGDLFGAEFAGRDRVVNLMLTDDGGLSGTVDVRIARDYTGSLTPQGNVSALLRRGRSTFNASLGYANADFLEEGTDVVRALPSRNLTEFRVKENDIREQQYFATASWAFAGGTNRTANLNARIERNHFSLRQRNNVFPAVGAVRDDRLSDRSRGVRWELGGDITRPFAGGGVKLIGLYRTSTRRDLGDNFNIVAGNVLGGFVQSIASRTDEAVTRVVWSRDNLSGWTVETGAEGAFNRLDSDVDLFSVASGGARIPINLPVDEAIVSEYRGEVFANLGRRLSPNLRADFGLTYEFSRLTVGGDTAAERSLQFWKPRASLDWQPGDTWRLKASFARSVAQLDFGDFVGAAELANDRVDGGNPDLLPQQTWEMRLSVERSVLGDGRVQATVGYDLVNQLQDRVPLPDGGDAPGNLGTGRLWFVTGTMDIPLATLGITGARLTASVTLRDSSVIDPYTLQSRFFSGRARWLAEAGFRQDLGSFAWGFNLYGQPRGFVFRRNEIDSFDGDDPFVTAFAQYRLAPTTLLVFEIENLTDIQATRRRTFFSPDRSAPDPVAVEDRYRNRHTGLFLSLRHSFG